MTGVLAEAEFLELVRLNPINAALLDRLPLLGLPQAHLVAGCLFGTVWNVRSGRPPTENIRDYDLFYYDPDTSYDAEDAVIRRVAALVADLKVDVEVRNQARVHLWFGDRFGQVRPPILSVRQGIDEFLVRCTCVGISSAAEVYAPYGLAELVAGVLRPNPRNPDQSGGELYRAKVASYSGRWPWLRDAALD